MQEVERTIGILEALARLGVKLAITEFGVGFYSSVSELRRMPVNTIKIDRSFVRDLNTDAQNCTLVEGMINLSRGPELKVVAISVENSEQLEKLRDALRPCPGSPVQRAAAGGAYPRVVEPPPAFPELTPQNRRHTPVCAVPYLFHSVMSETRSSKLSVAADLAVLISSSTCWKATASLKLSLARASGSGAVGAALSPTGATRQASST